MVTLTNTTLSTDTAHGGSGGTGGRGYYTGGTGGTGALGQGGGLYVGGGIIALTNTTLSTNTARGGDGGNGGNGSMFARGGNGGNGAGGIGGGIYVGAGTLEVTSATIAFNAAEASMGGAGGTGMPPGNPGIGLFGQSGGVHNAGGTLNALNTIFGDNTATIAPDFSGSIASLGYNLIGNSSGGSGYAATDLLDVNPLLGPLQDNGGPIQTIALLPGSPAINAGDPNQLGVADQRGVIRAGGVNIGTYQASASAVVFTVSAPVTAGDPFNITVTVQDA
jgi:hypothetical protein